MSTDKRTIPTTSLRLAGFTLAHAAWHAADAVAGETIPPFLAIEDARGRRVERFEQASDGLPAMAVAAEVIGSLADDTVAWAFVHEATLEAPPVGVAGASRGETVLTVTFWSRGMTSPARMLQRFTRCRATARFRLVGVPFIGTGSWGLAGLCPTTALDELRQGVDAHPVVGELWEMWRY